MDLNVLLAIAVGLILFMYGIESFSREIQYIARDRFRHLLAKSTKNRFGGTLLGTIVTALIQSSTATTVITVGLVSAGLISFGQSLGIIFGANIGTTITAQLVAFKITAFAPHFIISGFLISLIGPNYHYIGKGIFYFGLLFFGLNLISEAITPLKSNPEIIAWFAELKNPLFALFVGFIFTSIVQSSTVTTGIVVILASGGLIQLHQGIPLLLGANMGTTVTAFLASLKLNLYAKKAATAHALFNILGALLIFPFIEPFARMISNFGGNIPQQIANAHTVFNIGASLFFLIILEPFRRLVDWIIRGEEEEILLSPKYLTGELPERNAEAIQLIEKELKYAVKITCQLFHESIQFMQGVSSHTHIKIEKLENLSDLLNDKIEESLLIVSRRPLKKAKAKKIVILVRLSNSLEQLSDLATNLGSLPPKMGRAELSLSTQSVTGLNAIYAEFQNILSGLQDHFLESGARRKMFYKKLGPLTQNAYEKHMQELAKNTAYGGSTFVEAVSLLEESVSKIKDLLKMNAIYLK